MTFDQKSLELDEAANDLTRIVAETSRLEDWVGPVNSTVDRVRNMLGNYEEVAESVAVWNEHAVGRISTSLKYVQDAEASLEGDWQGPAFRVYTNYSGVTIGRIAELQDKMAQVAGALRMMRDTVVNQYLLAVKALAAVATTVVSFTGSSGGVMSRFIEPAIEAIETFIGLVAEYVADVITSFDTNTTALEQVRNVVATLLIPSPVRSAAPEIGIPDQWDPPPDASGG